MIRILVVLSCSLGLLACGGLGDDRQINSLSDPEVVDLCMERKTAAYAPTREETCRLGALFVATTEAECEASVTACLMEEPEPMMEVDCNTANASMVMASCTATVGNYRSCQDMLSDKLASIYHLECNVAGTPEAPSLSGLFEVAACDALSGCFTASMSGL